MSRKTMPLLLMLAAGAFTCVVTFLKRDSVLDKLIALLLVMLVFYFLGTVLKWFLDYFDRQNEPKQEEQPEENGLAQEEEAARTDERE
ncbi:MAG: hypothetical protein LBQ15_12110 [Clostridium sp.]|jgi:hypothetical protein|nr:hypothetical protein [Clostridium sp.]